MRKCSLFDCLQFKFERLGPLSSHCALSPSRPILIVWLFKVLISLTRRKRYCFASQSLCRGLSNLNAPCLETRLEARYKGGYNPLLWFSQSTQSTTTTTTTTTTIQPILSAHIDSISHAIHRPRCHALEKTHIHDGSALPTMTLLRWCISDH